MLQLLESLLNILQVDFGKTFSSLKLPLKRIFRLNMLIRLPQSIKDDGEKIYPKLYRRNFDYNLSTTEMKIRRLRKCYSIRSCHRNRVYVMLVGYRTLSKLNHRIPFSNIFHHSNHKSWEEYSQHFYYKNVHHHF